MKRSRLLYLLVAIWLTTAGGCRFSEPQLVKLEGLSITKFTKQSIVLSIGAKVHNPNNYKVSIVRSNLDIFINGENMGKALLVKKVSFLKRSTASYQIELENKPKNFAKLGLLSLSSFLGKGRLEVNIKGKVKGRAGLISRNFDVDVTESLKIPKLIEAG